MLSLDYYFGFLVKDYGFKKNPEYQLGPDIIQDYVKENIVISLDFYGIWWCGISRQKGLKKNADQSLFYYDVSLLDKRKKLLKSIPEIKFEDKNLWYFSTLLKQNPEVLNGDFRAFSFWRQLIWKLGF